MLMAMINYSPANLSEEAMECGMGSSQASIKIQSTGFTRSCLHGKSELSLPCLRKKSNSLTKIIAQISRDYVDNL